MLLTLRVTEERKRSSSVTTYRAPQIHSDRAVNDRGPMTADQFTTTPRAAAMGRSTQPQSWLVDGGD
jgi:hypothetical protein